MTETPPVGVAVTCGYPDCANQPRPARDGAGARPKYCGLPDPVTGRPHSALTAFRRRQEAERVIAGTPAQPDDLGRPVTMATARAAQLRDGIRDDVQSLLDKLTGALAQLERTADPEAAEAQLETVQAEAAEQIADTRAELARQTQRRQRAEADADEARTAALEADGCMQAAQVAQAQAEQAAAHADTAARAARADADREVRAVREQAEAQVATALADAARQVTAARADADAQIGQMRAERDTATGDRDGALQRAEQADRRADTQISRAVQAEQDARGELERVRADAERERDTLRQGFEARIAALEQTRADLRARGERAESEADTERRERARLSARLEELLAAHAPSTIPSDDTAVSSGPGPGAAEPGAAEQSPR